MPHVFLVRILTGTSEEGESNRPWLLRSNAALRSLVEAGHVTLLPMPSIDHTVDHTVDQDVVQDIQDIESNVGVASLTVSQYVAVLFDFFG